MRPTLALLVAATLLIPPGMCRCQLVGSGTPPAAQTLPAATCKCDGCRKQQPASADRLAQPAEDDSPDCPALRDTDTTPSPIDPPAMPDADRAIAFRIDTPALPSVPSSPRPAAPVPLRLVLHKFQI